MANLPPPPPPSGPGNFPPIPSFNGPRESGLPGGVPKLPNKKFVAEDIEKASIWPVVLAVTAILVSVVIWVLNRHSSLLLSACGYLLAPFIVILCLGFDNFIQRTKTSKGDWFVPNQNYGQILRILTGIAILLSYPHISGLADHISAWLAQTFPWMSS